MCVLFYDSSYKTPVFKIKLFIIQAPSYATDNSFNETFQIPRNTIDVKGA